MLYLQYVYIVNIPCLFFFQSFAFSDFILQKFRIKNFGSVAKFKNQIQGL